MRVAFHKCADPPPHSWWEARRSTGGRLTGGHMPIGRGIIPHDLVHLAAEAELGLAFGFWGLLAQGATFRHGIDRRRTRPGRALIVAHRAGLAEAEALANAHHHAWRSGQPTPLRPAFDRLAELWTAIPDGGTLTVEWPGLVLLDSVDPRPKDAPDERRTSMPPSRRGSQRV